MINPNRDRHRWPSRFFKSAFIAAAFMMLGLSPGIATALEMLVGTDKAGTFSHFTGRTICRIITNYSDSMNCKTIPAPDVVHNLTNLKSGSLDLVLADSRMLSDAVLRNGYFKYLDIRYDNLRFLVSLYDIPISLVVRKDAQIGSLEGLRGKRINAGPPLSPEHLAMDTILAAKGWGKNDFSLFAELPASQGQDTMAFCHGSVQAMLHLGVHPDPSVEQLLRLCNAGLMGIKDNQTDNLATGTPAYIEIDMVPGTYRSFPEGFTTLGTEMMLVTTEDLDEEAVYTIMQALRSNQEYLRGAHPALAAFNAGRPIRVNPGIPLHPGATKFLSEQ